MQTLCDLGAERRARLLMEPRVDALDVFFMIDDPRVDALPGGPAGLEGRERREDGWRRRKGRRGVLYRRRSCRRRRREPRRSGQEWVGQRRRRGRRIVPLVVGVLF